jgi:hypothetical protein
VDVPDEQQAMCLARQPDRYLGTRGQTTQADTSGDQAMTSRATNTKIAEAVARHAVGESQKPAIIGPLEVTKNGLVLHLSGDLFGKPATKTAGK